MAKLIETAPRGCSVVLLFAPPFAQDRQGVGASCAGMVVHSPAQLRLQSLYHVFMEASCSVADVHLK